MDQDDLHQFRNRLRILASIDLPELVDAAVISEASTAEWLSFRDNPWRWMILASDKDAAAVGEIIDRRSYEADRAQRLAAPPKPCEVCNDQWLNPGVCPACGNDGIPF